MMGQKTSSMARKVSQSVSSLFGSTSETEKGSVSTRALTVTPFIFTKQGSMFFDEDGDLAHEFFEEKDIGGCTIMEQHWRNLTPEGEIELPFPRLNVDFPIVICEAPQS